MPLEFHIMEEEAPVTKLKLALVGAEQNGKSRLASTARKPVLFHDFDNKSESLKKIKGVYVISYIDPKWPNQPTAAQDFLTMMTKMENSLDLADLGFSVPRGTFVKTNVVDSIQTFGKACQQYAMYNSSALRREIAFGGHKVFIPSGWDAVNAEMGEVDNFILRLLAMPTDTIITLHETDEKAADSTPEKPKYTGKIDVYPPRFRMLLKYFPEIWRVKLTQTTLNNKLLYVPRVYPLPTYDFDCGTTMLLDSMEDPNIEAMLAKHEQRFAALPASAKELHGDSQKKPQLKL
jgi:AAA domain